jgi:hypothetical protein
MGSPWLLLRRSFLSRWQAAGCASLPVVKPLSDATAAQATAARPDYHGSLVPGHRDARRNWLSTGLRNVRILARISASGALETILVIG